MQVTLFNHTHGLVCFEPSERWPFAVEVRFEGIMGLTDDYLSSSLSGWGRCIVALQVGILLDVNCTVGGGVLMK